MTEQPEALFLADELEAPLGTVISGEVDKRAAAELRRLHAVNAELLEALKAIELALKLPTVTPAQVLHESSVIRQGIRAAIAKAEGK
jgi:hypothetical protein